MSEIKLYMFSFVKQLRLTCKGSESACLEAQEYTRDRTRPLHLAASATFRALSGIHPDHGLPACLSFDAGADRRPAAAVRPRAIGPDDGLRPVFQSCSSCKPWCSPFIVPIDLIQTAQAVQ